MLDGQALLRIEWSFDGKRIAGISANNTVKVIRPFH